MLKLLVTLVTLKKIRDLNTVGDQGLGARLGVGLFLILNHGKECKALWRECKALLC